MKMSLRSIFGKHKETSEYGCKKCNHYLPEHYACLLNECIHGDLNLIIALAKEKKHKCESCPWGTWTGLNYKCALPRCKPHLGKSNGADKNGKQKNI